MTFFYTTQIVESTLSVENFTIAYGLYLCKLHVGNVRDNAHSAGAMDRVGVRSTTPSQDPPVSLNGL